jgi:hypothetical protein
LQTIADVGAFCIPVATYAEYDKFRDMLAIQAITTHKDYNHRQASISLKVSIRYFYRS